MNVIAIAQGSSDFNYNLSIVVRQQEADPAVQAIHRQFHLSEI